MEHAAFCLRGREVSTIAVYDTEYKKLGGASLESLESRLPSGLPEGEAGDGRAGQAWH